MGSSSSKPEFIMVLAYKQVKSGETITLCCKASTEHVTATWKKNDRKLCCVEDKHFVEKEATKFSLKIVSAEEADDGKYTINLKNCKGEISCSSHVRVELMEWRKLDLNRERLFNTLKTFKICNEVPELHFLLYGPVGAGKSSTINTIRTIFEGHQYIECLAAALSEKSQTKYFDRFEVPKEMGSFPFAFYDIMGLQANKGVHTNDIISALKGHMKAGYMCTPKTPLSDDSKYYLKSPSLSDQMHCLLCIIPADTFGLMGNDFLEQFKTVSEATRNLDMNWRMMHAYKFPINSNLTPLTLLRLCLQDYEGVPEAVLMTKVDKACVMTRDCLRNIYKSKKIREKMREYSSSLVSQ